MNHTWFENDKCDLLEQHNRIGKLIENLYEDDLAGMGDIAGMYSQAIKIFSDMTHYEFEFTYSRKPAEQAAAPASEGGQHQGKGAADAGAKP